MSVAESVPNPLGLPDLFNQEFATLANIIMPLFIVFGFCTRMAAVPILAVTLTGYFIVHANDPLAVKDIPFMYAVSFLYIAMVGAGRYSVDNYLSVKHFTR